MTYRGVPEWNVAKYEQKGWPARCSIFFEHETAARRFAEALRSNPNTECNLATFDA